MSCAQKQIQEQDFLRNLKLKSLARRIPLSGSVELTHRCNLSCKHCYLSFQKKNHQSYLQNELDTKTWLKLIDDFTEAGCLNLLITGGDPLIREDFLDIYEYAVKKGLIIRVYTNGTLISDRILDLFKSYPPYEIEITLYGATRETYENITCVNGSYNNCLLGIEKLLGINAPLKLKTMILTLNKDEFFAMEQMAKDWGVDFRHDCMVQPCLNGDKNSLSYRIRPEEIIAIDFANEERKYKWAEQDLKYSTTQPTDRLYNCGAGRISFHVNPFGSLMPCVTSVHYKYDLVKGNFYDGWNNYLVKVIDKKVPREFSCASCKNRFLCTYCPAFFYLENGSEYERSAYLCKIGHLRREELNKIHEGK